MKWINMTPRYMKCTGIIATERTSSIGLSISYHSIDRTRDPSWYKNRLFQAWRDSHVKNRRSWDPLIFTMGIPTPIRRHLYIEMAPRYLLYRIICLLGSNFPTPMRPLHSHRLTGIVTGICNYISSFLWYVITHPCLNLNCGVTQTKRKIVIKITFCQILTLD